MADPAAKKKAPAGVKKAALTAAKATPQGRAGAVAAKAAGKKAAAKKTTTTRTRRTTTKPATQRPAASKPGSSSTGKGRPTPADAAAKARPGAAPRAAVRGTLGKVPPKARKWLLAELVVCVLLLVLSGVTGTASKDGNVVDIGSRLAVKGSALAGVFVVLGLVSAGGQGAQKAAGALGALITLAYMFEERAVFTTLSDWAKQAGK